MSEPTPVRAFYRMATTFPPSDDEYLTRQDRQGLPRANLKPEIREAWNAFSAFDTADAAIAKIHDLDGLRGWFVVRYDIPLDSGIRWKQTFGAGHYRLWGDAAELKGYLADFVLEVTRPAK